MGTKRIGMLTRITTKENAQNRPGARFTLINKVNERTFSSVIWLYIEIENKCFIDGSTSIMFHVLSGWGHFRLFTGSFPLSYLLGTSIFKKRNKPEEEKTSPNRKGHGCVANSA